MADSTTKEISWYAPDPRAVLEPDKFIVPRSLRSLVRRGTYEVRWNTAFEEVMRGCADRMETWISEAIIAAYTQLHREGWAHSVEAWKRDQLEGGLYGISIGGAFFGESMYSRGRDASKVALVHLVERMKARGFLLLDTQFLTQHLARFGTREISRLEYLQRLDEALKLTCTLHP
ncbi:MAG: leucyl/phenylalanyl-tRNA--protein transferase [Ignavibacteria bacterium RIFCSPHIGHO2_02_FULL_56_12]|nr:MAG: leucyl/phenylalanyl-tRNA--protein transferase [Ignavibacteria bacterium RIFCSPHIGHO2_02_FULL_56_12]